MTDVKVLEAATGQPLKTAQSRGEGPASILKTQIDEISRAVSRGIGICPAQDGEAPSQDHRHHDRIDGGLQPLPPRARRTPTILLPEARRSLEKAISLDSTFAVAYLYLLERGVAPSRHERPERALKKAMHFAQRASEKERLYIEAQYASDVEHDGDKRSRILT